jgi:cohesin complex subunit SCC1
MNFDYADNENGFDDGGYVGAEEFNLEMNVEEDGAEEEGGDMDWNVNSKLMLDLLTSAFDASGDRPLSLNTLTVGKKRGEAARMFYQVLVLNAHEYLKVEQLMTYGDVAISKGAAFGAA